MKYAYNNNGVLYDVIMTHPSIIFPASYAEQFIEVPDESQNGWLWDGETLSEPLPPVKLPEEIQTEIIAGAQSRLDIFAKSRNYDSILSACTYITSNIPKFAVEGQYAVNMRDQTWETLYNILAEVQAGTRPMPTGYYDIEPELPTLLWP